MSYSRSIQHFQFGVWYDTWNLGVTSHTCPEVLKQQPNNSWVTRNMQRKKGKIQVHKAVELTDVTGLGKTLIILNNWVDDRVVWEQFQKNKGKIHLSIALPLSFGKFPNYSTGEWGVSKRIHSRLITQVQEKMKLPSTS